MAKITPQKFWFVRKTYGRGRTPATWQGRVIILCYVVLVFLRIFLYESMAKQDMIARQGTEQEANAGGNLVVLLMPVLLLTILLLVICYNKGERPKRQWGEKKK